MIKKCSTIFAYNFSFIYEWRSSYVIFIAYGTPYISYYCRGRSGVKWNSLGLSLFAVNDVVGRSVSVVLILNFDWSGCLFVNKP